MWLSVMVIGIYMLVHLLGLCAQIVNHSRHWQISRNISEAAKFLISPSVSHPNLGCCATVLSSTGSIIVKPL